MKKLLFCAAFCMSLFLASTAFAKCDPTDDPCAPKKELDTWAKSLAFGFNLTQGNSETTLLSLLGKANRETDQDLIDIGFAYNLGDDDNIDDPDNGSTTRNDFRADAGYRYLLSDRMYAGATTNFLYDEIADVDYRINATPLLGYFFVKNADFKFALEAGPGYLFEKVGGVEDDYFAPRIGDRFEWIITCTSKLFQTADITFDPSDSDNYLVNAEFGVEAAIASNLGLVFAVREQYDNQPAAGREKDDLAVITALKVAL